MKKNECSQFLLTPTSESDNLFCNHHFGTISAIAQFYAHERAARIYDSADEMHKISAARQVMKTYENKTVR